MINAAIVGLGWWGKTLVESLEDDSEHIRFVAGATRTRSPEIETFANEQGFDLRDTYEELLGDPAIDAVVLSTPHSMHAGQVAAAEAGKHIFCEKPFALTKADAEKMVDATTKAGVTLGLGYNRRFHPSMVDLRERIRSGDLGTILHVEGTMARTRSISNRRSGGQAATRHPVAG